jgi:hypothetical protein
LAVALYVASVLMYELALIPICLTGALYMLYAPRRKAAVLWAIDLAWMALTVLLVTSRTVPLLPGADVHSRLSRSQELIHAKLIYHQGRDVVAASMQPFGSLHYNRVLAVCAAVVVVAVLIWARLPRSDWARVRLQRWLVVAAAAIVGLIASWALFVPTDLYYSPGQAGIGNRINVMAGLFICVLAVALAMLLATSVVRVMRRREMWATIGALALIAAIGVGYGRRVDSDKAAWGLASKRQTHELAVIHFAVPDPRPGTEIVLFDAPGYAAPGVPIFAAPWDLDGAVQLSYDNDTLTAYPALVTGLPVCGPTKVIPPGAGYSAQQLAVAYGKTLFVNAQTGAVMRIRSRDQCQAALTRFPAGPVLASG